MTAQEDGKGASARPSIRHDARLRILLVIPEDWFALSHFSSLLAELTARKGDVTVLTHSSGRIGELEKLGARTHVIQMQRGSVNPVTIVRVHREIARVIDSERPDVVHAISLQSMALASLALGRATHSPSVVLLHLTGLGYLGSSRSIRARVVLPVALAAVRRIARKRNAWVLAENADDLEFMLKRRAAVAERTTIVPGAGIDQNFFAAQPSPRSSPPRAAFVGRMLRSKGVEVLVEAQARLRRRGIHVDLDLCGNVDPHSSQAIPHKKLLEWAMRPGVTWHGYVADIVGLWRRVDIAVVPSLGGEGVPRAMLEAASCARPLIVSSVPGCRDFVKPGVEGLVFQPGDVDELAAGLAYLATNRPLREQMGAAAREKVLSGYTREAAVSSMHAVYARALSEAL